MAQTNWYYTRDERTFGPFSGESLREMAFSGLLSADSLVAREGEERWNTLAETGLLEVPVVESRASNGQSNVFSGIAAGMSKASGLERLEGFSIAHLFSEVFRRHTPEEIEEHFSAGTRYTTPTLADVSASWPTPWAFLRLLGISLLASIIFYWAIGRFNNAILIPGWIFVGCFGIPFAVLLFFVESNILRNVSFYRVMSLLIPGGILSLVVSLFLFEYTRLDTWMGAMSAGLVEELGKLLAVVLLTRRWDRFPWIVNGMLFGAAVGTGFSAFESGGYVFLSLASGESLGAEMTMTLRAFLSPFTHTIWTAATAAALWRVKGDRPFEWSMMIDRRFVRIFAIIAGLHMIWNSPLSVPIVGGNTGYIALRIGLGFIGWIVILLLLQTGIKEIQRAQQANT